mmetsp:Transcript_26301/g.30556  ORF Transcript_26301/g.30556 Transcript_26301/m.30556 type:complete len:401 (+) Transcript_26301:236-1438(+)
MRFFLHNLNSSSTSTRSSKVSFQKLATSKFMNNQTKSRPRPSLSNDVTVPSTSTNNNTRNNKKEITHAFGQQCSPHCGCVIRFEANIENNKISCMSYDAKSIVSTHSRSSQDGTLKLQPVYTTNSTGGGGGGRDRPLIKNCKCKTLHSLAQVATDIFPTMTFPQAQNQLEFGGVRSSAAFRYTVLKNHNLLDNGHVTSNGYENGDENDYKNRINAEDMIMNVKEGKCYDLIEDALVACLKGYMPQPRKYKMNQVPNKNQSYYSAESNENNYNDDDVDDDRNGGLDPFRFVNAAKRRTAGLFYSSVGSDTSNNLNSSRLSSKSTITSSSSTTPLSMPSFHLMGGLSSLSSSASHYEVPNDTLSQLKMEIKSLQEKDESEVVDDWVSYIDERNKTQESSSHV